MKDEKIKEEGQRGRALKFRKATRGMPNKKEDEERITYIYHIQVYINIYMPG